MTTIIVIIDRSCHNPLMDRPIEQLINEVRLFYQSLVQVGTKLHQKSGISMGMRAILEYLDRNGNSTVPNMARARRVTRQRVQALVNSLFELGLAKTISNPASKRSPLIALTGKGSKTILEMRRLEGREMNFESDEKNIRQATKTLAELRMSLEREGEK